MASSPVFASAIKWISRGVAAANPQTIKLEHTVIKDLINSDQAVEETSDSDEATGQTAGLRGSVKVDKTLVAAGNDDHLNMSGYDEESEDGPTMKGLAVFANSTDDPYITSHNNDSEDEHEQDSMQIRPDDNLVVAAKFDGEDTTLLVYVYNSETGDFYVHHDYPIAAPVLCLENISYDPGVDNKKGNLLAVGTMNPVIEIWDLDIVNAVTPVVKLGSVSKSGRKKRDNSDQCHKDSVLSLSWNRKADHLLASGGADELVVLWDLDAAKPAQNLPSFRGMVQTLEWQPEQSSILLSGTRAGSLRLDDGRLDAPVAEWDFSGASAVEVEQLHWDPFQEHNAYVLTNDGKLRYIDTRRAGEVINTVQAHEEEDVGGLSLSCNAGLLTTIGGEQAKFWKNTNGQLDFIDAKKFHMGKLRVVSFCPDVPGVIMLGGEREDLINVFDVTRSSNCVAAFPQLRPTVPVDKLDRDTNADVDMHEV